MIGGSFCYIDRIVLLGIYDVTARDLLRKNTFEELAWDNLTSS